MAELYLGDDTSTGKSVVIKRMLPYLSEEAEFVQMFLDEARIASQLNHPNIAQLFELGLLEGSMFIAMEYVDGADLRQLFQEEQRTGSVVPYDIAAFMVAEVCKGLNYAHFQVGLDGKPLGIIHRDISPQNVVVGRDGQVKLVDFGIAKATAFMERSKPGIIKGKFLYLSPEQIAQEPIDHRSDLFALGSMLYEVTTGTSPFARATSEAILYAIRLEPPRPPAALRSDFPKGLSDIVMKCLEKEPQRRFGSAQEIQEALERYSLSRSRRITREDVGRYVADALDRKRRRRELHGSTSQNSVSNSLPEVPKTAPPPTSAPTKAGSGYPTAHIRPPPTPARSDALEPEPQTAHDELDENPILSGVEANISDTPRRSTRAWMVVLICFSAALSMALWPLPSSSGERDARTFEPKPAHPPSKNGLGSNAMGILLLQAPVGTHIQVVEQQRWLAPQVAYSFPVGQIRLSFRCQNRKKPQERVVQVTPTGDAPVSIRLCGDT